ncbi:MAG: hypothetical protein QOG38_209 [Hyphomicrobiales bacterium]|jgi:hypothetical protein|nr:hypothetical protein [Hyphomicrobiales bacterium]
MSSAAAGLIAVDGMEPKHSFQAGTGCESLGFF